MKNTKIVLVGGGSYNWCPRLISDMLHEEELDNSQIVLLDPNLQAAEKVKAAAVKMSETLERSIEFIVTDNEESAFSAADFVIITISTGDFEMMKHDLAIPEKYGIYHTVGDTSGPGGWCRTLRNVPVFTEMAQKIERLSPKAVILNYTNPMAALTGAICEVSSLRTVGLCHGLFSSYNMLEKIFKVEEKDIAVNFGGVNHFYWILDFTIKGEPGYPMLDKLLESKSLNELLQEKETDSAGFENVNYDLCDEIIRQYGYITYPGDRHTCEGLSGYINNSPERLAKFNLERTTIKDRIKLRKEFRKRTAKLASGEQKPFDKSRETAVDIMKAFINNERFIDVVNLPNIGQITNLPLGAVVETMGVVDAMGFTPLATGELPEPIRTIVEPHCIVEQMTLQAAMTGDRELALQSLMLDPLCSHLTPSSIRKMGNEMIAATQEFLPQF